MNAASKSKFFPNNFFLSRQLSRAACTRSSFRRIAIILLLSIGCNEARAEVFSINDAITQAVLTNPGVGEAAADRRADETRLYQAQGAYLPQVRLESAFGPEKFTQAIKPPPLGNGEWLNGKETSIIVRQILFDGFAAIHEIWGHSVRVDAAAFRVRERTELTALDAAEAYIDVVRFLRLVALANQNVIVPVCVVVGNAEFPTCEPAGSTTPATVRADSPASNTCVSARPGASCSCPPVRRRRHMRQGHPQRTYPP